MDILKGIPQKQVKLILLLITLMIVVCSYFFGYQKFSKKAERLEKENRSLTVERNELQEKNRNKAVLIEEMNMMRDRYETIMDEFPSGLTQDKNIMFIHNLAKQAKMEIKVISLGENELFYSPSGFNGDTSEVKDIEEVIGYKTNVTISYSSTYEGLKKCINHINDYKDRMNITGLTAAFDQATGNLSGTLMIDFYALGGTDKKYEDALIHMVPIGTDNIFGTFEKSLDIDQIEEEPEQ